MIGYTLLGSNNLEKAIGFYDVAPDRAAVDRVHAAALASGGIDEGAAGERGPTFYGAYFRDLDGNKLCVFKMD